MTLPANPIQQSLQEIIRQRRLLRRTVPLDEREETALGSLTAGAGGNMRLNGLDSLAVVGLRQRCE